jgi:acetoin utilization protein AcuB
MYVRDLMSAPVITVTADTGAGHALQMMREKIIRRVAVVDAEGRLVGIVNDRALLRLLSERRRHQTDPLPTVGMVMTSPVITTQADQPLEEAGNTMAMHRVGALLVVDADHRPVGIITDRDLYRILFDLLGTREPGLRIMLRSPATNEILTEVAAAVSNAGGVVRSFGMITQQNETVIMLKVKYLSEEDVRDLLRDYTVEIESITQG